MLIASMTSTEDAEKAAGVRWWSIAVSFVSVLIYCSFFFLKYMYSYTPNYQNCLHIDTF